MSLDMDYQSMEVKDIDRTVTVPDNKLAKLMYYLACVFKVIQYDHNSRFTDFQNYNLLSNEEEQTVLGLVALFNPKIMVDLSIFIVSSNLVPHDKPNEFYEITDDKIKVHVNSEVVIGGNVIKVLKVMACTKDWINRYYFNPASSYSKLRITSVSNYITYRTTNNNNNNNRIPHPCTRCCNVGFCLALFVVILSIIRLIYF